MKTGTPTAPGPVALVTGAIRGIGLAVARRLAGRGVRCCLTYYDWLDHLPAMHRAMEETGVEYRAVGVDLTTAQGARGAVEACLEGLGRLDFLVLNVERGGWPVVHGPYTPEQWELEFRTTVTAKWLLFQEALPHLKEAGGAAVNITSMAGEVGRCGPAGLVFNDCYSLANRGLSLMTAQWARMAAPQARVNELVLGLVETRHGPSTRGWGVLGPEEKQALLDHTLLGRTGTVEEVARCVEFLLMEAGFVTGARLVMDGGYLLGGEAVPPMPQGVVEPGEPTVGGGKSV